MANKKLKVNRNRYDFGGAINSIPSQLLNYSQNAQNGGDNTYMQQIANPDAFHQEAVMKHAVQQQASKSDWLMQGFDILGHGLIDVGVGLMGSAADKEYEPEKYKNATKLKDKIKNFDNSGFGRGMAVGTKKFGGLFGGLLHGIGSMFAQGGVAGEEQNVEHVPIEAEGGEMIAMPWDNQAMPIEGASHENGGVDMTVPVGSKIYSKRVKDANGKSMAYRKERRDRELKKWQKIVKDDPNNQIAKDTLEKVRRNNEIEEANDMAYMQLHKAKKQFSDYIKDVTKDYGKGGGLNIAAARQAIDQHNMQPVEGEREQYFTGAYVKKPNYGFLGRWYSLQDNQQPLTIDTVKRYISSKLPGFKFNGLINSDPAQGALTPEQQKYFFEEIAPYLDYHAYMNDPSKIIADGKTRDKGTGIYQAKNFNYSKYKQGVDNAFKGLDPSQFSDSTGLGNNTDIPLIISQRLQKLQQLGQLNIPSSKQINLTQGENFDLGKTTKDTQDNTDTPFQITQSQQNLSNLGISNIPYINKSNITRPTGNYQALQYNQAKYNKTLQDAFTGVDTNQFIDSTGSSTNSDVPATIRQDQQNLANLGQLKSINMYPVDKGVEPFSEWLSNPENRVKGIWDIKLPVDNQVGKTSTDTKATATKQVQDSIGQSYRPAPQVDFQALAALISNNDPRAFALLQNINNNTLTKPTAKGNQSNTGNTNTKVAQPQVTQQDIEQLRKRLPKTITMNGRSYNTDALLDQLNQNPLARLALGQSIFSNDGTSKQSGKSTNKVQQSTKKSQGKDISNFNPNDIDKLIQSGWNPLFALTSGLPTTVDNNTRSTANTGNEVSANSTYNPNNFSYSPDYMAELFGLKKDDTTGEYYDPKTIQQSPTSVAGDNTTTDVAGDNTLNQSGVTAIDYNGLTQDTKKLYSDLGNLATDIYKKEGGISNPDYKLSPSDTEYINALKVNIGTAIDTAKQNNLTPEQLKDNIIKVFAKDPLFKGQEYGVDEGLTEAVDKIMAYAGIPNNNNNNQDNKTVQGNNTKSNNINTDNKVNNNQAEDKTVKGNNNNDLEEPKPPVKPELLKLNKINLPNPFDSQEEEDKFWEDVISSMDDGDTNTKSITKSGEYKTAQNKKVEHKTQEDQQEEKPNLWSVLGGSLNPAFGLQLAGILHNMIKPKKTAEDNFRAKQRYKNNYRDYGKKSLLELDKMKDNLQAMMDQNIRELENQRTAQTYINNNSARDINVARALNLASLAKTMDATNRVYANQAALQNNIHQARANMLSNIDHRVMGEDRNTQTLNNQLIDNYFNNKATADMIFGTGLQNIGKLFDNREFIKQLKNMYKERTKGLSSKSNNNTTSKGTPITDRAGERAKKAQVGKPSGKGAVKN